MLKYLYRLAPIYTAVIAYFSLSSNAVPSIAISNIDKIYHATAYAMMFVLWYLFFYVRYLKKFPELHINTNAILHTFEKSIAAGAGVICFITGVLLEFGQGYLSENRTMDIYDVIANTCGIILAVLLVKLISKN